MDEIKNTYEDRITVTSMNFIKEDDSSIKISEAERRKKYFEALKEENERYKKLREINPEEDLEEEKSGKIL